MFTYTLRHKCILGYFMKSCNYSEPLTKIASTTYLDSPHANTLPKDMHLLKFGQNLHLFGICFFTSSAS